MVEQTYVRSAFSLESQEWPARRRALGRFEHHRLFANRSAQSLVRAEGR